MDKGLKKILAVTDDEKKIITDARSYEAKLDKWWDDVRTMCHDHVAELENFDEGDDE